MPYDYHTERTRLLAESNIPKIMRAKDQLDALMKKTGAITYGNAMALTSMGDSWQQLACLDYLVECGFYRKLPGVTTAGQDQLLTLVPRP
jgi:hypothetical protein